MMNQYYGFTGRGGRMGYDRGTDRGYDSGYDRTPYRRPMNRIGMPDRGMYPYGSRNTPRVGGGCGCGLGQGKVQPYDRNDHARGHVDHGQHDHGHHDHGQYGYDHAVPAMDRRDGDGGCGCGNGNRSGNQNGCNDCNGNRGANRNGCNDCNDNRGVNRIGCNDCNGNRSGKDNAACKRLMDQIRAVDFALYETVLYLNVYPKSCDALETYHKLKEQSKALHKEYEATCTPLTAFGNQSTASWDWMSRPFPWEYDAD